MRKRCNTGRNDNRRLITQATNGGRTTDTVKKVNIGANIAALFGQLDENVKLIEKTCDVSLTVDGDGYILIRGKEEKSELAALLITELDKIADVGEEIDAKTVTHTYRLIAEGNADKLSELYGSIAAITAKGKKLRIKSAGQLNYFNAIKNNTVVICIGPAGTGKTFLAVARAVNALRSGEVQKIILTRPAIEAGEKLGFLPGDLQMKFDPYLRPLYDALEELMGESYLKLIERGVLEIAPLAYMRGRTLKSSFVILDEAQNTTVEQMKMFLTRLGEGSKMIAEGDLTQTDLPPGKISGLGDAAERLKGIDKIAVIKLNDSDVVRHELVQKIVNAYENPIKGERKTNV